MSIQLIEVPVDSRDGGFGSLETDRGLLPLAALEVRASIVGLAATTRVRQRFVNTHDQALEATYVFPLPDRGAVRDFRLRVAGREVVGELKERGEARETYDRAIAAGHRAAIAEEERPDTFTMRVGNLPPGEEAVVELELVAPLDCVQAEAEWRFPLVVAPRYVPGTPLDGPRVGDGVGADTDAAPDASRVTPPTLLPGFPNPIALTIEVELDAKMLDASKIRATLHAHEVERDGSRARVSVRPGQRVDRDFILRFAVGEDAAIDASASRCATPGGQAFSLLLSPPAADARDARPRDIVFILDRSGSMDGWKMIAARRAVGRMLDSLDARDRFNLIAFDSVIDVVPGFSPTELTVADNRNRWKALEFLSKLDARGGTEMARPLNQAAEQLATGEQGRDRSIVLITDGQIANEDQILRELGARLGSTRVFTVGIDRAVQAGFLRRLAQLGGGFCELIESEERLDEVMDRVHLALGTPALSELSFEGVDGARIASGTLRPATPPALFVGTPLVVRGLLEPGVDSGAIRVRGVRRDGSTYEQVVPLAKTEDPSVGALWARQQIRALEDEFTLGRGSRSELERRIVSISLRHRVLCRFTSFVAVDREETIEQAGDLTRVVQPVEQPSGWTGAAPGVPMPASMPSLAPQAMAPMGAAYGGAPPAPPAGPVPNQRSRGMRRAKAKAEARADFGASMPSAPAPMSVPMNAPTSGFASFDEDDAFADFEATEAPMLERFEEGLAEITGAPAPMVMSLDQPRGFDSAAFAGLLGLFEAPKQTGVVVVTSSGGAVGRITLLDGRIVHAAVAGRAGLSPDDALLEILGWTSGEFVLESLPTTRPADTLDLSCAEAKARHDARVASSKKKGLSRLAFWK